MCGICGTVGLADRALLARMMERLAHRGPDDAGVRTWDVAGGRPAAGLAHRRLSVIDLSAAGHQPMASEDGQVAITYNGEVYNFGALRGDLEAAGHRFRSQTDTEVILRLYLERGAAAVSALRGMFAFAIWDARVGRLLLARDRLGVKPLYYLVQGERLVFASELKALLAYDGWTPAVDEAALLLYLSFLYIPSPGAILRGVRKLPPGHVLIFDGRRVAIEPYWRPPPGVAGRAAAGPARDRAEARRTLRALLEAAVAEELVSDVPLGAFLSGGIDSSTVVGLMARASGAPVRTFSIGYGAEHASFDERAAAGTVARAFGTAHREFVVRPDVAALLPVLAWHLDEPFADSSMIPTYLVARAARAEVTVALTGIGGDEVFGGYPRYLGGLLADRLGGTLQGRVGRRVATWVERLPETTASRNLAGWAKRFLRGAQLGEADRYIAWISAFDPAGLERLCEPSFLRRAGGAEGPWAVFRERYGAVDGRDVRDRMALLDLGAYLPDDLLMLGDKMSMASGLEVRVPLCDHRLVEFVLALPPAARVGGLRLKALLKEAVADLLPPAILARRKQGFSIPLGAWLRGPLRPLATSLLSPECVAGRGYFRPAAVQALLDAHWRGTRNVADQIFALMMLELWHRTFLEAVVPEARVTAAERR